jgi:hypothetical protein
MSWSRQTLLEDIGLAPQNHRPYQKKKLHLDKGEIDPKSFGGVAVVSSSNFNEKGGIENLDLRYWAVYPDGRYEKQHLFQMEVQEDKKGRLGISYLSVLGREISLGDSKSIDNVLEAIRRIHVNLRDREPELPDIARIFKDCRLEDIVGEKLPLPGFHEKSRLYFPISPGFNIASINGERPEIILPLEAIRPLLGIRKNTLDPDHSYIGENQLRARGIPSPEVGRKFEMVSRLRKEKRKGAGVNNRKLDILQHEADLPGRKGRPLVRAKWSVEKGHGAGGGDIARLRVLDIFDQSLLHKGFRQVMGGIGVVNMTHTDMLKSRDYPRMQDHLALYGHLESANSSSIPPPAKGRFVMTSVGGNNLREIYPGIGEDIGGNCKVAETQWIDRKTGTVKKLGAILDLGAYIIRKQSEWTGGGPDIIEKLPYCKDIFISHHHLDHLDFIIPYIKRHLITPSHMLHMTPEVWEMAKEKLGKWGVKPDDPRMPKVNFLKGAGVIDLKDEKGVIRMSVAYGVDAVPHSAKDTPFIAYGRNGKEILGSYMYLGDMRFDEDWFKDHDSPFWEPVRLMLEHDPTINPEHLIPTYTELDATSAKRQGRAASERQVEDNLVHILQNWLFDKQVGVSMIGTNDGRRETLLRAGNRTQRKMTAFGAAVEKIFAVANKLGVNPYRLERPEAGKYTGIADYFNWHAKQIGVEPSEFCGRTSDTVRQWFETNKPGSIMAFLSGSQGNPVEIESMTYKLSDGLSYFDADARTSKTARPVDLKDWAIIVSQSAIPGNSAHQKKMIKKIAARGAIVFEAYEDNLRIHNAGAMKERILTDLENLGRTPIVEADGAIVVESFPIHASGHGRNGDFRLWLHKLKAKYYGLHHTDDRESVMVGYDTIEEEGKLHPGGIFENGVEVEIGTDFVRPIGRTHSSVVMTKDIAEEGKHYNKRQEVTRFINFDDRSPHHDLGLRGSTRGVFETGVGMEDIDDVRRRQRPRKMPGESLVRSQNCRTKPRRPFERLVLPTPPWSLPDLEAA